MESHTTIIERRTHGRARSHWESRIQGKGLAQNNDRVEGEDELSDEEMEETQSDGKTRNSKA